MRLLGTIALLLGALLLGGCSAAPSTKEAEGVDQWAPVAWRLKVKPLTQPVIAAGTAVLYVDRKRHLELIGVDVSNGRIRWRHAASAGGMPTYFGLDKPPIVTRSTHTVVAFIAPGRSAYTGHVVMADVRTGRIRERDRADSSFVTSPEQCTPGQSVCWQDAAAYGIDSSDVAWVSGDSDAIGNSRWARFPEGGRLMSDVVSSDGADEESIGVYRGSLADYLWKRPITKYFGSHASSDQGWDFESARGITYGTVENVTGTRQPLRDVVRVTGIRESDGKKLWQRPGEDIHCFSGQLHRRVPASSDDGRDLPTSCLLGGRLDDRGRADNFPVVLRGFDPRTGATRWSKGLGTNRQTFPDGRLPSYAAGAGLLLRPRKPVVVDLVTGETRSPREGEVFLCRDGSEIKGQPKMTASDGSTTRERYGEDVLTPCDVEAKPVARMPRNLAVEGATSGGVSLLAQKGALVAYRL